MIKITTAIGKQYELEAERLTRTVGNDVIVFDKNSNKYERVSQDSLIDGLYHKSNFANYIDSENTNESVVFMDADMFTLKSNPFENFSVKNDTDFAYVPYEGKWWLPDEIRQNAFDFHGHKINSGFMYFKNINVAKEVCNLWQHEYLEREKLYNTDNGTSKYEYDEWALMIALMQLNLNVETLYKKWNNWGLNTKTSIKNSDSIFFQSHDFLEIDKE